MWMTIVMYVVKKLLVYSLIGTDLVSENRAIRARRAAKRKLTRSFQQVLFSMQCICHRGRRGIWSLQIGEY